MGAEDTAERLRVAIQTRLPEALRAQVRVWNDAAKVRARVSAPDDSTLVEHRELFVDQLETEPALLNAVAEGMSNEARATWEERMREEKRIIEGVRQELREEVRFFSNAGKAERERWVVSEFLTRLGVQFAQDELHSPEQDDDADVLFRDARFQVKEMTEPDLRRGDELRTARDRAERAERASELFEVGEARDIACSDAGQEMLMRATDPKYPATRRVELDLLFYVTRSRAGLRPLEAGQLLAEAGWRSISCLYGQSSMILVASDAAPAILQNRKSTE